MADSRVPGPLQVLYLDDAMVAVSKPSGLLTHRDEHHPDEPAALQCVRDQLGRFLYPVHRLDRATSGILVYAFSSADAAALQASMSEEAAHKDYLALVRWPGSVPGLGERWTCDRPLHDERDRSQPARTDFALIAAYRHCALVACRLYTGRYHQIRRHGNHSGRHVIGDTTHGKGRINALFRARHGLDRLFLHSHRLELAHPRTAAPVVIEDPLPAGLEAVLRRLAAECDATEVAAAAPGIVLTGSAEPPRCGP